MKKAPEIASVSRLENVIEIVCDMVAMFRSRGEKTEYALLKIADVLAAKPYRVKSLFYRDRIWPMGEDEAFRIKCRFSRHLETEITHLLEKVEDLRVKKHQLDLELQCEQANSSPAGFGFAWETHATRLAG